MIKLEHNGLNQSTMTLTLSPFDLIRLQWLAAYSMTHIEDHLRDNQALTPARRTFWQNELTNVERDWGTLQRILDEYNERL